MKKNVKEILILGGVLIFGLFLLILVPIFMLLDFFGANVTDGYVENNITYAEDYRKVLNNNITKGYVSLERILYFSLADESLTYEEIYNDNIDSATKKLLPINEVCNIRKYKALNVCNELNINNSNQINELQAKPFVPPINFASVRITSFFMEERYIFETYDIHKGWDFSADAQTEVYSVCDGEVENISFSYITNETNKNGGLGNYITINCNVNDLDYKVTFGHLYPNSSNLTINDTVTKGQTIASVGTTGYSTGNHLHYAVKLNNVPIDGMSLIDFSDIN